MERLLKKIEEHRERTLEKKKLKKAKQKTKIVAEVFFSHLVTDFNNEIIASK